MEDSIILEEKTGAGEKMENPDAIECDKCGNNIIHDESVVEITHGFNCHGGLMKKRDKEVMIMHKECGYVHMFDEVFPDAAKVVKIMHVDERAAQFVGRIKYKLMQRELNIPYIKTVTDEIEYDRIKDYLNLGIHKGEKR